MINGIHHTAISTPDLERALGFYRDLLGAEAVTDFEWPVGSEIADHCVPISLRGGVLEAQVESSVWSQQLQPRRPEILAGLRRVFGDEAPTDVRFRVG